MVSKLVAIGPGANDVFGSGVGDGDAMGMLVYPTDDMEGKNVAQ